jgi:hypothetical protein
VRPLGRASSEEFGASLDAVQHLSFHDERCRRHGNQIRHGYGVLLLDARGYDGSQGDPNLFGWDAPKDIDAAVDWLRRQPDVDPPGASAASASPWAVRQCCKPRRATRTYARSPPKAQEVARTAKTS